MLERFIFNLANFEECQSSNYEIFDFASDWDTAFNFLQTASNFWQAAFGLTKLVDVTDFFSR